MKILRLLCFAVYAAATDAAIYTNRITVTDGSSFMNYVQFESNGKVSECSLTYLDASNNTITSKLNIEKEEAAGSAGISKRIISLGRKTCGLKFIKYTAEDPIDFTLEGLYETDKNETKFSEKFTAAVYSMMEVPDPIQIANLGDTVNVNCAPNEIDYTKIGCTIVNPQGKTVFIGGLCSYKINRVTLADIGAWKCLSPLRHSMEPLQFIIELQLKQETAIIKTSYKEQNDYGIITCEYLLSDEVTYCLFTRPDGEILMVNPGGATDRYISFGTDYNQKLCEIGFKLPHADNEIGSWGCNVAQSGGFIAVKSKSIQDYPKYIEMIGVESTATTIKCKVPYSTDQCYIQAPNGTTIVGKGGKQAYNKGECTIILTVSAVDFGNWTCHFAQPSSAIDDVITVNLVQFNKLTPSFEEIEVDEGDSAIIMCKSKSAIYYCRFIDPSGISYHASPNKPSTTISYYGKGLNYGECGIEIAKVKPSHEGVWTCIVQNGKKDEQKEATATTKLVISKSFVTTASSIGVPVGIMAAAIILLAVALFVRFRKKSQPAITDNISTSSEESVGSFNNASSPINRSGTVRNMYTENPFNNP